MLQYLFEIPTMEDVGSEENKAVISKEKMADWGAASVDPDAMNLPLFLSFHEKVRKYVLAETEKVR